MQIGLIIIIILTIVIVFSFLIYYFWPTTDTSSMSDIQLNTDAKVAYKINPMSHSGTIPLSPIQVRSAYQGTKTMNGLNQKIAILVAYNYDGVQADLDTFCGKYGLPQKTLYIHKIAPKTLSDEGWALEACLDVQYATLFAPKADIHIVFAKSPSLSDLKTALSYINTSIKPDIVSMSLGIDEKNLIRYNLGSYFEDNFSQPNTLYLAASGDNLEVSYPSSSPKVISVGGTTLYMSGNNAIGETDWSAPSGSGAGGGLSNIHLKPAYQTRTNASAFKMTPDISAIADAQDGYGVAVVYKGKVRGVSGTSLSCPCLAGLIATGFSYRTGSRQQQVEFMAQLYNLVPANLPFNTTMSGIGAVNKNFVSFIANT
jgi:subtilase family serine protease